MKLVKTLACACFLAASVPVTGGCGNTTSVLNYENEPIYKNQQTTYSMEEVRDKIAAGVQARKWGIEDESKGWMVARVTSGGHWAKVRITYDADKYTIIHFESSEGLKWNGERIHRRYNNWVKNLNASIQKQFLIATPASTPVDGEPGATPTVATEGAPAEGTPTSATAPAVDGPEPDPSWNDPE